MSDRPEEQVKAFKLFSLKESLSDFANFSTIAGLIISCTGGAVAYSRYHSSSKTVHPLYHQLYAFRSQLHPPIVTFPPNANPYKALTAGQSVILQGRNKEGKTTLLCTFIPWHRRWLFPWYGIYLNGSGGQTSTSFGAWLTTQMYGTSAACGSEVPQTLDNHMATFWFRALREHMAMHLPALRPRRPIVIVDQFEELMMRFPSESLKWANQLTNAHVRDNKARVIFVVNSEDAVASILALNQGQRWRVLPLKPPKASPEMNASRFDTCEQNIGLYKEAAARCIPDEVLAAYSREALQRWREQYHVPYPLLAHGSWRDMCREDIEERLPEACRVALKLLYPKRTAEEINHSAAVIRLAITYLAKEQILAATQPEWERRIAKHDDAISEGLAVIVKITLGQAEDELRKNAQKAWEKTQKAHEQEAQKKPHEEEAQTKAPEEGAQKKPHEEEARTKAPEEGAQPKAHEEGAQKKPHEEEAQTKAPEEGAQKKPHEEEARTKAPEEGAQPKAHEQEALTKTEEVDTHPHEGEAGKKEKK